MARRKAKPARPAKAPQPAPRQAGARFGSVDDLDDDQPHVPKVKALPPMPAEQRRALPPWPKMDPTAVELEKAQHAIEGNRVLQLVCDELRMCLQEIHQAQMNLSTKQPVTPDELRALALEGLEAYTRITGTPWKRNRVVRTRAARSVQFRDVKSDDLKREGYE